MLFHITSIPVTSIGRNRVFYPITRTLGPQVGRYRRRVNTNSRHDGNHINIMIRIGDARDHRINKLQKYVLIGVALLSTLYILKS